MIYVRLLSNVKCQSTEITNKTVNVISLCAAVQFCCKLSIQSLFRRSAVCASDLFGGHSPRRELALTANRAQEKRTTGSWRKTLSPNTLYVSNLPATTKVVVLLFQIQTLLIIQESSIQSSGFRCTVSKNKYLRNMILFVSCLVTTITHMH